MNTHLIKYYPASPTAGYDQYPPGVGFAVVAEPGEREQRHVSDECS